MLEISTSNPECPLVVVSAFGDTFQFFGQIRISRRQIDHVYCTLSSQYANVQLKPRLVESLRRVGIVSDRRITATRYLHENRVLS